MNETSTLPLEQGRTRGRRSPLSEQGGTGLHRTTRTSLPPEDREDTRVTHLRNVEAQKRGGRLRNAECVTRRQHNVFLHGRTCDIGKILTVRQTAPEIKAAARHQPGLNTKGLQPNCHLASFPTAGPMSPQREFGNAKIKQTCQAVRSRAFRDQVRPADDVELLGYCPTLSEDHLAFSRPFMLGTGAYALA